MVEGLTRAELAFSRVAGRRVRAGEIVTVEPDRVLSHDNTAFIIKKFKRTGRKRVWDPEKIVIVFDHCVPALNPGHLQNHEEARAFVAEQGLPHFFDGGVGVCHQVMCERGFVLPGQLVVGADSHSTLYGALGAFGVPINRTEMAGIWATGKIWLKVPESLRIVLRGALRPGVYAKDLILKLLQLLGAAGATYQALEWTGPAVSRLSMSERMTLANMAVELGAKAGLFPADEVTRAYLKGRSEKAWEPLVEEAGASYARELELDLDTLSPQVACPHGVDNVRELSEVAGRVVHHAYLGSCTNGRLEDLRAACEVLRGRRVAPGVRLVVYPASSEVAAAAREEGLLQALEAAGAEVEGASCGPCFGAVGAVLKAGEVCVSSSNRNFCGRMGSKEAEIYLASPALVAASCVAGRLADPREYLA